MQLLGFRVGITCNILCWLEMRSLLKVFVLGKTKHAVVENVDCENKHVLTNMTILCFVIIGVIRQFIQVITLF